MNKKNLFKFLTFFLVLVISFCITKIPTSAGKIITDNGTNYDTLTLSGTDLVGTQTAYVVKNQITKLSCLSSFLLEVTIVSEELS